MAALSTLATYLLTEASKPANLRRFLEIILFFFPELILYAVGMGPAGPVARFLAPLFQARFGTPLVFRAGQSAAMGGRAAVGFKWVVRVVLGVVAAVVEMKKGRKE